ncbi:MAG: hypothetical protein PVG22_08775 [Chromatiales bacterium]|jgi:hypothetical protein
MRPQPAALSIFVLFVSALLAAGCTPEKAKTIRIGAEQFSAQALEAVEVVEAAFDKELAPPPRTPVEIQAEFVESLKGIQADQIDFSVLELAADPYHVELTGKALQAKKAFFDGLRTRYNSFSGMLEGLEYGSFFAGDAVGRANTIAIRLTADMAAIAKHYIDNPPRLIQYRAALTVDARKVVGDDSLAPAEREQKIAVLLDRLNQIKQDEAELQHSVVETCMKASALGLELHKGMNSYNQLTVADLQDLVLLALQTAGEISGRDMSTLVTKSEQIFDYIKNDQALASALQIAMNELQKTDKEVPATPASSS